MVEDQLERVEGGGMVRPLFRSGLLCLLDLCAADAQLLVPPAERRAYRRRRGFPEDRHEDIEFVIEATTGDADTDEPRVELRGARWRDLVRDPSGIRAGGLRRRAHQAFADQTLYLAIQAAADEVASGTAAVLFQERVAVMRGPTAQEPEDYVADHRRPPLAVYS